MSLRLEAVWAPQPHTTRSRRTPLSYDPNSDRLAYGSGKQVVIRSASDPGTATLYTEHTQPVSAVAFAPSGQYVVSGDAAGGVRVWGTPKEGESEIVTKGEYGVTGGRVNDLSWDFESKRIIAVGDGKERFGHAFMWDTGNSVGEIAGHSAEILGVSIRPKRPLRAVTVGEDSNVVFFEGAPFKFAKTVGDHSRAVSDVAYSPNGDHFVTAGLDRRAGLFDGDSGSFVDWLNTGHEASLLAVTWLGNDRIVTTGVDATVRVFDVTDRKTIAVYELKRDLDHQQVGLVVTKTAIVSLGFNGDLNFWPLDGSAAAEPIQIVSGHHSSVSALARVGQHIYSASHQGHVIEWQDAKGHGTRLLGGHDSPVVGFVKGHDQRLLSAGWDRHFRQVQGNFSESGNLLVQPLAVAGSASVLAGISESLVEIVGGSRAALEHGHTVDVHGSQFVAVGAGYDLILYNLPKLDIYHKFDAVRGQLSAVKFSPDGKYIAAGDSTGKIVLYSVPDKSLVTTRWAAHSSRVTSIAWHEDGERVVTGALDTHVVVYSVKTPSKNIKVMNAHTDGVTQVDWLSPEQIVSAGSDGSLKVWALP